MYLHPTSSQKTFLVERTITKYIIHIDIWFINNYKFYFYILIFKTSLHPVEPILNI